jgi:hypothetical protein
VFYFIRPVIVPMVEAVFSDPLGASESDFSDGVVLPPVGGNYASNLKRPNKA